MAVSNNTIKTRIQLKSDTEANWNKAGPKDGSPGFIPLRGELIIYSADETHDFSRLKVGDGVTNVVALPFIDAGTLNGEETEIIKRNTYNDFPFPGSPTALYVDLSTNLIYHYSEHGGYTQLLNINFTVEKTIIGSIVSWLPGVATTARIENSTFQLNTGILPELLWEYREVVTDVTKEEST